MIPAITTHQDGSFLCRTQLCTGRLASFCTALVAVEVHAGSPPLTLVPHASVLLSIEVVSAAGWLGQHSSPVPGLAVQLISWPATPHSYVAGRDCRKLFALLTPQGAVAMAKGGEFAPVGRHFPKSASFLPPQTLDALQTALVSESDVDRQIAAFGAWLENECAGSCQLPAQAKRAARVATGLFTQPALNMAYLARTEGLSRRQLERDFQRWFCTSPKQASLIARGQAAARLGFQGWKPVDVAAHLGFSDQAHLNRTVKKLFGVSPLVIARSQQTALSRAFRYASGGGLVFL